MGFVLKSTYNSITWSTENGFSRKQCLETISFAEMCWIIVLGLKVSKLSYVSNIPLILDDNARIWKKLVN